MANTRRPRREVALDYLVSVVESPHADPARRDAAARLLLQQGAVSAPAPRAERVARPPRPAKEPAEPKPVPVGKKEQQLADADAAGKGTPWEGKL